MARLRAPGGCPWDREQTFDTIKRYTLEETYEVLDAIERRDWDNLREELGDFLLQAVFHAQMASEQGLFSIEDSLRSINEKLIRRHPHVFGDVQAATPDQVLKNWDQIKATEKPKPAAEVSILDTVNRAQPALMEANEISKKAARAGFEWEKWDDVAAKVREELDEVNAARASGSAEELAGEIGDLLFSVVNLARWAKIDPEMALRATNAKFRQRFAHVERCTAATGKDLAQATLEEMEAYWQDAKQLGSPRA
jgi:MazG family protein